MSGLKELWPHGSTSEGDKGGRGIEGASRSPWGKERSGSGQKLRPQGNAYRNRYFEALTCYISIIIADENGSSPRPTSLVSPQH